jgi:L-threonylcarbamoyladenylate synthase
MSLTDLTAIDDACKRLKAGKVVAVPTETVYGLAASIESDAGLRRVFQLKQRPFFDPLIVHVSSFKQAKALVSEWPPLADYIARVFWPGPLTIVLPKAKHVNPLITSGLETVAVRFPRHKMTLNLIERLGSPIAAPSANRFGRTSPSRPEHVKSEFPGEDLLILDGGACEVGVESTVISIANNEIKILRPGGVTDVDLEGAIRKWAQPVTISRAIGSENSPGHLKHHYMPDIPLIIVSEKAMAPEGAIELRLNEHPEYAARELYSRLRELAATGSKSIFVRRKAEQNGGFWEAIWDRLSRAATQDQSNA